MFEFDTKEYIAWRCAQELENGIVNLGIGIPTLVSDYIEKGEVTLHSENGILGVGSLANDGEIDIDLVNASKQHITAMPHTSYFDSSLSFGMMRGGHLDATVIGALQVSETGDIASWAIPGQPVLGVGGAMDLVVGARKVIVAMTHTNRNGQPKILKECTYPLTAAKKVDLIVTEYAVFKFLENEMWLVEKDRSITFEKLKEITPANYKVSEQLVDVDRKEIYTINIF